MRALEACSCSTHATAGVLVGATFEGIISSPNRCPALCIAQMVTAAGARAAGKIPNLAVAGLLAVFVGGSYFTILRRVSHDDLDKELDREVAEELRRQQKEERSRQQ